VEASRALSKALEMQLGPAYAGFDQVADCRVKAMRLTGLRLLAQDERLAALMGAGGADRVVAEAEGCSRKSRSENGGGACPADDPATSPSNVGRVDQH
jgi:hypothetical protein